VADRDLEPLGGRLGGGGGVGGGGGGVLTSHPRSGTTRSEQVLDIIQGAISLADEIQVMVELVNSRG